MTAIPGLLLFSPSSLHNTVAACGVKSWEHSPAQNPLAQTSTLPSVAIVLSTSLTLPIPTGSNEQDGSKNNNYYQFVISILLLPLHDTPTSLHILLGTAISCAHSVILIVGLSLQDTLSMEVVLFPTPWMLNTAIPKIYNYITAEHE